jgi:hypothetical protein
MKRGIHPQTRIPPAALAALAIALVAAGWTSGAGAQVSGGVERAAPGDAVPVASSLAAWVAQIKTVRDLAWVERDGRRLAAGVGMRLRESDLLVTSPAGAVGITFNDNSTLAIGPDTRIVIQRFAFNTTTYQGVFETRITRGTVAVQPGQIARQSPDSMRVFTPAAELRGHAAGYVVSVSGDSHD